MKRLVIIFALFALGGLSYRFSYQEGVIDLFRRRAHAQDRGDYFTSLQQNDYLTLEQIASSRRIFESARHDLKSAGVDWEYTEFRRRVRVSFRAADHRMHVRVFWVSHETAQGIAEGIWSAVYRYLSESIGGLQEEPNSERSAAPERAVRRRLNKPVE